MEKAPGTGMKKIDLDEVFKKKNPGLYRWIPGFVMRFLKNLVHQDDMNRFIELHGQTTGIEFLKEALDFFETERPVEGLENVPLTGTTIIVANHPLGGLDGLALIEALHHRRKDIKVMVNDILLALENLSEFWIPVNKHGRNTQEHARIIEKAYLDGNAVIIFPAGLVSRKKSGIIKDLPWKKTFITRSKSFNCPVIPAFIEGNNRKIFYRVAKIREALGIKATLEMTLLPAEMFAQRKKRIGITFGKPISPDAFNATRKADEWAAKMRDYIYCIPNNPELTFEEFLNQNSQ
jgi:putative hemolysin